MYINNRLGLNITEKEARTKYKIILNFKEFILHNDIENFSVDVKMLPLLQRYCIGFLSYDQSHIIFRSINIGRTHFRYHMYNIFGDYDDAKRFYTISSKIDILKPKLNVVITEGTFDIIGVYNHFYKDKNLDNYLFMSVNGKGFNLIFLHLARLGFLDMDINIYSDGDVKRRFFENMKKYSDVLKHMNIKLNYNKIGKDYGVSKAEIELKYSYL